jgi:Zn-dependent protease with chaperone function
MNRALIPTRKPLSAIAPAAWEHPADRVALQALRALPGFDEVVKKLVGYLGERGIRLLFQANAVRVGPNQLSRLDSIYEEVMRSLDCPMRPELFVSQAPFVNAGAYGMDRPFIVLQSATMDLLDDEQVGFVLGHELGHVMSGHALYHTLLVLVLNVGLGALPAVAELARLPLRLTLLEWYRKSELSCDRAGVLAIQNPPASLRTLLKLAGGGRAEELNLEAFLEQAREYEEGTGLADRVFKILNTAGESHPFHTLRAAELDAWIRGGEYEEILSGQYRRRMEEDDATRPSPSIVDDLGQARDYYVKEAKAVVSDVVGSAKEVVGSAKDAVRNLTDAIRKK